MRFKCIYKYIIYCIYLFGKGFKDNIFSFDLAQIDKPWRFDHKVKRPVIINEIIDANMPHYAQGPGGEVHKEVGCCCCPAGMLDITGMFLSAEII